MGRCVHVRGLHALEGERSVVPRKLGPATVPALPVYDQFCARAEPTDKSDCEQRRSGSKQRRDSLWLARR